MARHKIIKVSPIIFVIIVIVAAIIFACYYFGLFDSAISFVKSKLEKEDDNKSSNTDVLEFGDGELNICFLELGNKYTGDSIYIKAGDTDILIDAGSRKSSSESIAEYLDQYVTDGKIEYVIATHAHQDHIAGFVGTKEAF